MKAFVLKRPLMVACSVATIVGIACGFISSSTMMVLAVALLFAFTFILPFKTELKSVAFITVLTCVAVIVSNVIYYNACYKPVTKYEQVTADVEAEILQIANDSIVIMCNKITQEDTETAVKFKVSVYVDDIITLLPSQKVKMTVRFFECVRRPYSDGTHIYGIADEIIVLSEHNPNSPRFVYYNLRRSIKNAMPFYNGETTAFVNGMVFGDTSGLSPKFENMLNTVGLSHVTSVSGMHLMFSVLLVDFVMSLFAISHKKRAVMAILSVAAFTVISGFSVSCIRAAIMITVYYIGIITDKLSDSITSLSLAVYAIVLFSPRYSGSVSLLLSAAATFGIIVLSPCYNKFFLSVSKKSKVISLLVSYLTMSLAACCACFPVTATLFGEFYVIAPLVNVILAFPIQILFYIGIFAVMLSKIPFISSALAFAGDALYYVIEFVVKKCYYIKNTTLTTGYRFYYIVVALIIVLVLGLYLFYVKKLALKFSLLYISMFAVICLSLFVVNKAANKDGVNVHFVDVGDGNCSLVTKDESAAVIDCGGDYFKNIERVLQNDNVKQIKLIALTHFDFDHINYLKNLVNTYDVETIVYPYFADISDYGDWFFELAQSGVKVIALETDDELSLFDGVKIKWYVEKAKKVKPYDNMSAVYRLEAMNSSVLYAGDMSINQEYAYLNYSGAMNCDILNVAHHGSKGSSYIKFLTLCSPKISVISVNANSKMNNPDKAVVNRLESLSEVLLTSKESTISFKINNKGYKRIK